MVLLIVLLVDGAASRCRHISVIVVLLPPGKVSGRERGTSGETKTRKSKNIIAKRKGDPTIRRRRHFYEGSPQRQTMIEGEP